MGGGLWTRGGGKGPAGCSSSGSGRGAGSTPGRGAPNFGPVEAMTEGDSTFGVGGITGDAVGLQKKNNEKKIYSI